MNAVHNSLVLAVSALLLVSACQSTAPTNTSAAATEPAASSANTTQSAVAAFVAACVRTADNPNAAGPTLESLGFRKTGGSGPGGTYSSSFATAVVSVDTRSNSAGQCVVTPKSATFGDVVALLGAQIAASGVPAMKLGGEEAWILGNTGAVALVSRSKGAMTRTQPGVFRG
jgi:cytochrome c2